MDVAIKNRLTDDYWVKKLENKETYVNFMRQDYKTKTLVISESELSYFNKITKNDALSKLTLITAVYAYLLKKYFIDFNDVIWLKNDWEVNEEGKPLILMFSETEDLIFKNYLLNVKDEFENCFKYRNYQNNTVYQKLRINSFSDYSRFGMDTGDGFANNGFGLLLNVGALDNGNLVLNFRYDHTFIDVSVLEHFTRKMAQIFIGFKNILNIPLSEIELLDTMEKNQILTQFNATEVQYPQNKTVIGLFEEQVEKSSENTALVHKNIRLTYAAFNALTNQLGHYLRENHKVKANDIIGVKLERSELMVIAIYGILKSGGAYMPIDPNYPQKRIDFMTTDTNCKTIIDVSAMESFLEEKEGYPDSNLSEKSSPDDLAYVIYTSGTTGFPKGVMIRNTSLVNRLTWMQKAYSLDKTDTLIQKTTYAFDVSVWEIFWWGMYGAKLVVPLPGIEKDPEILVQEIFKNKVSVLHFVPSALSLFLDFLEDNPEEKKKLSTLKQVFASGEVLTEGVKKKFTNLLSNVFLMNLYGPTEATIDVSYFNCTEKNDYNVPPIGKPIDNIKLFILDKYKKPAPIGVIGNLFISGVGVAKGYVNNQKLTSEKFVVNPFDLNSKMYDTGDLAKWLQDGNVDYIGRSDSQVKLRGYRIELGEIEKSLMIQPEIKHAIVDLKSFKQNEVLAAYIVWEKGMELEKRTLNFRLEKSLPKYMIPSFYVNLNSLPVKKNGKLKRESLPPLLDDHIIQRPYIAPKNKVQIEIAEIWQDVLGVQKIGVNDDFFELGGHSLMVTQIINRMSQKMNKTISVKDFMLLATIEKIEPQLRNNDNNGISQTSEYEETII
ncbi:non-ribosomal peptide synthetase [Spongiimicrobium salis]|uniref:non-ribosomal peptide synthetase n=1 Tax=Spongiimicrobium salis TaxID=1667022 RepID=UPI00374CC226